MTCFLLISASTAHADPTPDHPLSQLDWLIGKWAFVDKQINGDYLETGTRTCRYTMNDSYILCVSKGRTATGPEREYLWYFNYNDREERYEGFGLFSSYPRKQLYEIDVSEGGNQWDLAFLSWEAEGVISDGKARIVYNGKDQYIWDSLNGPPDAQTGKPTVSFRDTVSRVIQD